MRKLFLMVSLVILAVLLMGVASEEVLANGTETLGPPANISIGTGTGIVAAGSGLITQPGTININVPGDVVQALLYWACTGSGDDAITVEGTPVTGQNIGERQPAGVSFRADITDLVSSGPNTLEVTDLDCGQTEDGAGVLVIFDDGTAIADIRIRDGFDFVFSKAAVAAGRVAVAKTFFFPPEAFARTASLKMFFADCEAGRPDRIQIRTLNQAGTVLTTTNLDNMCSGSDGPQWDTLNIEVQLPAGANRVRVQPQSKKTSLTTVPDSFIWITAVFSLSPIIDEGTCLLLIDEDTIDNGIQSIEDISFNAPFCGGPVGTGDPAKCVNDDLANPGVREILFTRDIDITPFSGLLLPTGQTGDEGLFMFTNPDPQVSNQNNAMFTIAEFIDATGAAADENNLDKIDGVVPLSAADINALQGKQCCAVVYDSDISVDIAKLEANLKGATLGLTAFEVTSVGPDPDGSVLPPITVDLLPSGDVLDVCGRVVPPQPN